MSLNYNIENLIKFHKSHGKLATLTVVRPTSRFGEVVFEDSKVTSFKEKPLDDVWINGGYFVLEPQVLENIENDSTVFEQEPLTSLVKEKELLAWQHRGFWACMDTTRDKNYLCELWETGTAPWKIWED